MIGTKVMVETASTAIHNAKVLVEVTIIDKFRMSQLIGDQNGEGHVIQQDCYLAKDKNDKAQIISPSQIIEIL